MADSLILESQYRSFSGPVGRAAVINQGPRYGKETQKEGEWNAPARPIGEVSKYPRCALEFGSDYQ